MQSTLYALALDAHREQARQAREYRLAGTGQRRRSHWFRRSR
jgi:hypothetical protein